MKTIDEVQKMLESALNDNMAKIKDRPIGTQYYNSVLGDTSFILAGLLELHLRETSADWNTERWMDDSLISEVSLKDGELSLSGTMIWGIGSDTEQWTEPFNFMILIKEGKVDINNYIFLFGDLDRLEVAYGNFRNNRDIWQCQDRNWRYTIDVRSGKVSFFGE
jgi:hypothetical protein